MKKHLAYASIVVALLSLSYLSISADSPNRPEGVTEENWVPVSDRLGIVLVQGPSVVVQGPGVAVQGPDGIVIEPRSPLPASQNGLPLLLKPPVGGYFMVKRASGWTRLVVFEPIKGPAGAG
ncbi:MAG: hypothetical protein ABIQ86_09950 [Steroidobacteraceae bacterium]